MKKYFFVTVFLLSWRLLSGNTLQAQPHALYLPVTLNDYCTNQHLALNFLAFGDSITGCYYDSYVPGFPYCGYEKRVYDRLNQQFGFCRNALAFYNKSEGGETTTDGLARFAATIATPTQGWIRLYPETATKTVPDLVIIMEGTNDLNPGFGTAPDIIESNLRQMVAIARQQGKQVILATIPPAVGPEEERGQGIAAFNPRIFGIGLDYGIPIADVFNRLYGHPEWMTDDGLHFNDAGFDQMADVFYQAIIDLLFS
jgi:lysophospholipase L1-like esterase